MGGVVEVAPHLLRVVAQEVDRLAHFGDGVGAGLAGFAHQQRHQPQDVGLEPVGAAFEHRGARLGRGRCPRGRGVGGGGQRRLHVVDGGVAAMADDVAAIGRVEHRMRLVADRIDAEQRLGRPGRCGVSGERGVERAQLRLAGEIEAERVHPHGAEQRARQDDRRMRQADRAFRGGELLDRSHRVLHQLLERHRVAGDAVDERGVGAVLEQSAHEVGEQRVVGADRRIDPARPAEPAFAHRADHLLVERLAHAVQALELVLSVLVVGTGERVDGGQGVGVVGGELRIDLGRRREQLLRAGEIGDVGVGLAGVDRIAGLAVELGALDLAVPVRALHQPHHQPAAAAPGEVDEPVDHRRAALLVGLDDEADAVPAGEGGLEAEPLQQVERELEAIGLFGIDVEADVVAAGELGELQQARIELGHHPLDLRPAVARMQGRELDRDAGPLDDAAARRGPADRLDRGFVGGEIGLGIARGHRRFAEHVVRVAKALGLARPGIVERLLDRLAGDELLAHQAHRHVDAAADQRLAAATDDAPERRAEADVAVRRHQAAGEQQPPGGGVDEQRRALAEVRAPVAARRSCRGSARRGWRHRECAAALRPGTSAPRPRSS